MRDRRSFLARAVAGATALAGAPLLADRLAALTPPTARRSDWDDSWTRRITGKHRAVFDIPEIAEGFGVIRSHVWYQGYEQVYGTAASDLTPVAVFRHNGIYLAMNDAFWQAYGLREKLQEDIGGMAPAGSGNPFLKLPFMGSDLGIEALGRRGCVTLCCALAFAFIIVPEVMQRDGLSQEAADQKARGFLLPGMTLQPSGIFAVSRAQELNCGYVWVI